MGKISLVLPVPYETTQIILHQMTKCICNVITSEGIGNAFFCAFKNKNKLIKVMITNNHVINKQFLEKNNQINIELYHELKKIDINDNRKIYTNIEYDITIIEINPDKDGINDFLELDDTIFLSKIKFNYIYILQFSKPDYGFAVSYGRIFELDKNYQFKHLCSTRKESSGSPILNIRNNRVIGIHCGENRDFNIGNFLDKSIIDFINDKNLIKKYKEYSDKDFSNLKLISSGSYGDVYSAFSIQDKTEVCLKKINLDKMKLNYELSQLKDYQKDLNNEINILKLLSFNNNSVKYLGDYDKEKEKIIVMEKCDKNLYEFIKQREKSLTVEEIKQKFEDLNELFKIIQRENIIHRDLKLENFLIKYNKEKTNYIIKLGDYGTGKFKGNSNGIFSGLKGTIDTVAPEIILEKTKEYESKVDIFSLGIILYQISHNLVHPFGKNYIQFTCNYNNSYEKDNLNIIFDKSITNKDFKDLIIKMTKLNPKNRLNWEGYFNHSFFKNN